MSPETQHETRTTVVGRVASLRAFPVKSLDAAPLASARFLTSGVQDDRRWAVVDEAGEVVNAKRADVLRTVRADVLDDAPRVTLAGGGALAGADAETALSLLLGEPVTVAAAVGGYNEVAPVHVVSRQAIAGGHAHDDEGGLCPCSVEEPRANLVLDLVGDGLETGWVGARLQVGAAVLRISKAPRHCLGVYADVLVEGQVSEGDEAVLTRD